MASRILPDLRMYHCESVRSGFSNLTLFRSYRCDITLPSLCHQARGKVCHMAVNIDGVPPLAAKAWRIADLSIMLRCQQAGTEDIEVTTHENSVKHCHSLIYPLGSI